jgi:hypothetical protein
VDLVGNDRESDVAADLAAIEDEVQRSEYIGEAILTLSRPGAAALRPATLG